MRLIFIDSSALLAGIINKDTHHRDVISLLEFILEKYIEQFSLDKVFIINDLVYIESLSKLTQKGTSFSVVNKKLNNFLKKYHIKILKRNKEILSDVINLYQKNSRYKFKNLQCNDFIILADSIKAKAILITCDEDFLKLKPSKYKDIYYISSKSKRHKDQFLKLLANIFRTN